MIGVQTIIVGGVDLEIQRALWLDPPTKPEDAQTRILEHEASNQASNSHIRLGQTPICC